MKIHIITIGQPKLQYAKLGFGEYVTRLKRYHQVRVTHVADKWANDTAKIMDAAGSAYKVALVIDGGEQLSSHELAAFLDKRAQEGREVCFLVGGPDGLPTEVIAACDYRWSFSKLTFPHDLAMVILAEAVYRGASIGAGQPYHH